MPARAFAGASERLLVVNAVEMLLATRSATSVSLRLPEPVLRIHQRRLAIWTDSGTQRGNNVEIRRWQRIESGRCVWVAVWLALAVRESPQWSTIAIVAAQAGVPRLVPADHFHEAMAAKERGSDRPQRRYWGLRRTRHPARSRLPLPFTDRCKLGSLLRSGSNHPAAVHPGRLRPGNVE